MKIRATLLLACRCLNPPGYITPAIKYLAVIPEVLNRESIFSEVLDPRVKPEDDKFLFYTQTLFNCRIG
jgi:hypothetical protein